MPAGKDQDDAGDAIQAIEGELGGLRSAVEDAVAAHQPGAPDVARARAKLAVALASFGSPEFDLEARFHIERIGAAAEASASVAIARSLIFGDIHRALADLADAVASPEGDETELLKLTFSAVIRARPARPRLPWLKELLGRVVDPAQRGAAAIQLVPLLPDGGCTRADLAEIAVASVSALWPTSPEAASWLINAACRALVDVNDQALLAMTAGALLRSLPPAGIASQRNTLGYLLITSLNNAGDIAGCVEAMDSLLATLLAETWDRDNFRLLTSIASVAAEAAAAALSSTANDLAVAAVALADRAFGVIERVGVDLVPDDEPPATQQTLNAKFSQVMAVARSLSQNPSLEITQPDPAPLFRFREEHVTTDGAAFSSPGRSARISEARFLEECARVDWKAIPTPQEVDFGIDYRIEIPDSPGRTTADVEFLVQLKSTSAKPKKSGLLTVAISATTLKYWKSKVLPTLVVLFHHPTNRFYTAWYLPALDDAAQRTFRFAQEDEWDPITLRADVQRYYQHVRAALASGGDWSLLSVVQFHCALLIKTLLLQPDVRRAALDPEADLSGAKVDQTLLVLISMHHRALCSPLPLLAGQPVAADLVKLIRTLDAIVRSWTLAGPQGHSEFRLSIVATHRFFASCRDLLHVAVELDCALASAIVTAQESRSAALASAAGEPSSPSDRPDAVSPNAT